MTSGLPLWRLSTPSGQVTECYVDTPVSGDWLLTIWADQKLHHSEVFSAEEAAHDRARAIKAAMLAEGWKEPQGT